MTTTSEKISVLIRTFNSAKTLDRVLSQLRLQEDEEIIVVDSGSADATLAIAARHGARVVRAEGPFNYSKSLNLGFREARTPWVLVLSSHSIPVVPDLLAVFRSAASQFPPEVVAGYGPNAINGQSRFADDGIRYYAPDNVMNIHPWCGNGNTLYRRSAWEAVPFDEGIRTGEDKAWLDEAVRHGMHVAYVSGARTLNRSQYSLRYMFRKGYSDARALPHNPMSIFDMLMGLASMARRFSRGGMPVGNWIRYSAHVVGTYFGSQRPQDNTPGR